MTQSFDEWMDKNHGGLFDMPHQRECFEAGAKSRQVEIDEFKATIVKYEAGLRKNKANKHKLLAKNIELQKRIDETVKICDNLRTDLIRENHVEYDKGWKDCATSIYHQLKGKEDE